MDIETIKLIVDAGPHAVTMFGYYVLGTVGSSAMWATAIGSALIYGINRAWAINYWDALSSEEQAAVALKKYKLGFKNEKQ